MQTLYRAAKRRPHSVKSLLLTNVPGLKRLNTFVSDWADYAKAVRDAMPWPQRSRPKRRPRKLHRGPWTELDDADHKYVQQLALSSTASHPTLLLPASPSSRDENPLAVVHRSPHPDLTPANRGSFTSLLRKEGIAVEEDGSHVNRAIDEDLPAAHMGNTVSALVFQPPSATYGYTHRYFFLVTAMHNRIPAFFIPCDKAEYTVLFSHGNAEDLGMIYDWFREVSRRLQANVMSYDYSGYGISEGEPSEEACFADIEAAFAYLVNSSLEQPVAGLILQSPVLSMFRVVFNFRYTLPGDLFCNIDIIEQVRSPVTVIHGTRDEVVPFWHGEGLFEMCPQEWRCKPLWVTDAGHNNIEAYLSTFGDDFFQHLIEFVHVCHVTATIRAAEAAEQKALMTGKTV
ncbi:Alpha/beta hydrolase fold-5 [Phytophthora cactorum]|nr:Alpha/beta hydrolase fold-5 [Phytophthora cactorum]